MKTKQKTINKTIIITDK